MTENRKYNTDATFYFPLITEAAPDFILAAVPAAGDCKLWTTAQIAANPTSFILGFDSMSELPSVGDQIDENGAGTAQAVVMDTIITSGTIGGGDAAGFMFVKSVSGQAWSNDDQIDINGGTANIATADSTTHDLAATAGLIGVVGGGQYAVGLTAAEMSCIQGTITIIDAAGDAYEDQAVMFTTYGNASALHAFDLDLAEQTVDVVKVSGDATAADNLEAQYDTTGLTGDAFPSTQAQVGAIGGSTGGGISFPTLLDNTLTGISINNGGAAVDKGTSPATVGIPVTGHSFVAEQQVTIANTVAYNSSFTVDSVSANEVVIVSSFTGETFGADDTISSTVKTIGFVGSVQGGTTVSNTEALDGVLHDIDDTANDIDIVYTFDVGGARVGTELLFHGFVQSNGDSMHIEAYDHIGLDWEVLRVLTGSNGATVVTQEVPLLLKHTGTTGVDRGKVFIRFDVNVAPTNLSIDQILVEAINRDTASAYDNGRVWINTNVSNENTEVDFDGTSRNPVSTIAALKTLSASTGLSDFHVINGSSFTFAEDSTNESYFGDNWALALGGQEIGGIHIQGADPVTGISTAASEPHFDGCDIGTASIQIGHFDDCTFTNTLSLTKAGNYKFQNCQSGVAGTGSPTFAFSAVAITAEYRRWSGSITFSGLTSDDTITVSGTIGVLDLGSPASAVAVEVRGTYKSITNVGSASVNTEGAINVDDVWDEVITNSVHNGANSAGQHLRQASTYLQTESNVDDPGAAATTTVFNTDLTQVDDFWNDALFVVTSGALLGQSKPILDFANTNGQITLSEPLTSAPADNVEFTIFATHIHPVGQIADGVLDEALSGHTVAGTLGKAVTDMEIGIIIGAAATGTLAIGSMTTDLTGYADDQLIGRILTVTSGDAEGEIVDISDYASASGLVTFANDLTTACANGDTFKIT